MVCWEATDNADQGVQTWKLVIPDSAKTAVFFECHDDAKAGHFGTFKTHRRIAEKYYWPRMARDVKNYVLNCDICKACKPTKTKKNVFNGEVQRSP
jgi:Integrase zinc binding domain